MRSRAAAIVTTSLGLLVFDGCRAVLGIEEPTDLAHADGGKPMGCLRNSDCTRGDVCLRNGTCGPECLTSMDCQMGARCVKSIGVTDDAGTSPNVCQLFSQAVCRRNTDCDVPLICAADLQCRNQCAGDRDCVDPQKCTSGVCADQNEINPNGTLAGAVDGGFGLPGSATGGTGSGNGGAGARGTGSGGSGASGAQVAPEAGTREGGLPAADAARDAKPASD